MFKRSGLGAFSAVIAILAFLLASCSPPGTTEPPAGGDTTPPTVVIQSLTTDPTGSIPIDVKVIFSEAVSGFDATDLTITNASVGAGSFHKVDDSTYTLDLTPDAPELTVTVDIHAGVCADLAGNPNHALGTAFCRTCTQRPTVVIGSSITSAATNASAIPITITFNKAVENFVSTDVTLTNSTMSGFATADDTVWTATLTPSGQGEMTVLVAADVCNQLGAAAITNVASSTFTRTYDSISPAVALASSEPDPANTSIQITITYSEAIDPTTFSAGDISVSGGGSAGNLQTSDNIIFTADVAPGAEGLVTIGVAAGRCQDSAGNDNTAAPAITRVYDSIRPSATITSTAASTTNVSPVTFTITFSEQLAPGTFTQSDLLVLPGGSMSNFAITNNTVFTVDVTPQQQGSLRLNLAEGVCQDAAGNTNTAATLTRTYDSVSPSVSISSATSSTTSANPIPVTLTFSEQVSAGTFTAGDITVGGGTAGNLQTSNNTVFTADITPTAPGAVTVGVAAEVCTDLAGNTNTVSNTLSRTYDTSTPPGALDTTFFTGSGASSYVYAMAQQADGKVLIGGSFTTYGGASRAYIARINADDTRDTGFVTGAGPNGGVYAIAVQPDQKIVIAGWFTTYNGASSRVRVVRLNTDGTADSGFYSTGFGADNEVNAVALQSDNKILIAGEFAHYLSTAFGRVGRINTDGTADTTFTTGTGADARVYAVAVQPDGKILIGGNFTSYNGTPVGHVARLNADGTLDAGFNASGVGTNDTVYAIIVQSDNRIVIGGNFTSCNGTTVGRIARLQSDGTVDSAFTTASGSGATSYVRSMALQGDGKILICGAFGSYNATNRNYLARLNADGSLDTGFLAANTGASSTAYVVRTQADGKVLLGGMFTAYASTSRGYAARIWY